MSRNSPARIREAAGLPSPRSSPDLQSEPASPALGTASTPLSFREGPHLCLVGRPNSSLPSRWTQVFPHTGGSVEAECGMCCKKVTSSSLPSSSVEASCKQKMKKIRGLLNTHAKCPGHNKNHGSFPRNQEGLPTQWTKVELVTR